MGHVLNIRQGGVLSVLMYATVMDEIAEEINKYEPRSKHKQHITPQARMSTIHGRCSPNKQQCPRNAKNARHHKLNFQQIPQSIWE